MTPECNKKPAWPDAAQEPCCSCMSFSGLARWVHLALQLLSAAKGSLAMMLQGAS